MSLSKNYLHVQVILVIYLHTQVKSDKGQEMRHSPPRQSERIRRGRIILRLFNLFTGLILFGISIALMVSTELGVDPWDVLHQGVARQTGISFGTVVILASLVVLVLWIPLRQRPGFGTVANAVLVGLAADATLGVLPDLHSLASRFSVLVGGILLNGLATGLYIGARLGPGPRDGLMTGLAARGLPLGPARTAVEIGVLAIGWVLGGQVGLGTLIYAVSIGPLVHFFIPVLTVAEPGRTHVSGCARNRPNIKELAHDPSATTNPSSARPCGKPPDDIIQSCSSRSRQGTGPGLDHNHRL